MSAVFFRCPACGKEDQTFTCPQCGAPDQFSLGKTGAQCRCSQVIGAAGCAGCGAMVGPQDFFVPGAAPVDDPSLGRGQVGFRCPGCGRDDQALNCLNCGANDQFKFQLGGARCSCGQHAAFTRCQCGERVTIESFFPKDGATSSPPQFIPQNNAAPSPQFNPQASAGAAPPPKFSPQATAPVPPQVEPKQAGTAAPQAVSAGRPTFTPIGSAPAPAPAPAPSEPSYQPMTFQEQESLKTKFYIGAVAVLFALAGIVAAYKSCTGKDEEEKPAQASDTKRKKRRAKPPDRTPSMGAPKPDPGPPAPTHKEAAIYRATYDLLAKHPRWGEERVKGIVSKRFKVTRKELMAALVNVTVHEAWDGKRIARRIQDAGREDSLSATIEQAYYQPINASAIIKLRSKGYKRAIKRDLIAVVRIGFSASAKIQRVSVWVTAPLQGGGRAKVATVDITRAQYNSIGERYFKYPISDRVSRLKPWFSPVFRRSN